MARKSPKQRKKEREQQKQRGQQRIIFVVIAVVVILGGLVFALNSVPTEAPIPDYLDRYNGFLTSTTAEGYPLLGNPEAPVEVREYSSFSCPGCLAFHDDIFPQLLEPIARGEIAFIYVPLQTGSIANPEGAARTAICASEQDMFWEMHDVLFSWHEIYGNAAYQDGRIRSGVDDLGLNTGEFNRCFNSNETTTILTAAQQEGVTSTPTITVNGAVVSGDLGSILAAIESNLPSGTLEPGQIIDEAASQTEDAEAMEESEEEPMEDDTETEEETSEEDADSEEEPMEDDAETEEETSEEEAEATEASE